MKTDFLFGKFFLRLEVRIFKGPQEYGSLTFDLEMGKISGFTSRHPDILITFEGQSHKVKKNLIKIISDHHHGKIDDCLHKEYSFGKWLAHRDGILVNRYMGLADFSNIGIRWHSTDINIGYRQMTSDKYPWAHTEVDHVISVAIN